MTVEQVSALRLLVRGIKRKQFPTVISFIVFKNDFDSMHRGNIMKTTELIAFQGPWSECNWCNV